MAANPIASMMRNQKEQEEYIKREKVRKQGYSFFDVIYKGSIVPNIDSEGEVINIRMHGINDVDTYEETDPNDPGRKKIVPFITAKTIRFKLNAVGDVVASILDDTQNRHFIATHPDFEVAVNNEKDAEIKKEIEALVGIKYEVEPSRLVAMKREKERLEMEIAAEERINEKATKKEIKKEIKNGNNKPNIGMD